MKLLRFFEGWRQRSRAFLDGEEVPLSRVPLNLEVEVTRFATEDPARIHRLASLGILPGARLHLIQNRSAYLAVIDRYQVAFDAAVAAAVWVRRVGEAQQGSGTEGAR